MIACVYCAGEHERPAEVKQCWADHQGAESSPAPADHPADEALVRDGLLADRRSSPVHTSRPRSHAEPQLVVAVRRGPDRLGRNVVVGPRDDAPADWTETGRIVIDDDAIADPEAAVELLRAAAFAGRPMVIELWSELDEHPASVDERDPYLVGVGHRFAVDELYHWVWANSIDRRDPSAPKWSLVDRAVAAGATQAEADNDGDVILPDGSPAWLTGGPIGHFDAVDGVPVVHAVQLEHGRLVSALPNQTTADLAADQLAAVTHAGGPARIIAPAGSGKTRVLTERARHLLNVWQLPPGAVSLVAFNKRAQEEMQERTSDLPGLQVRTLNAIALAIINGSGSFAPQRRRWTTINEPDVRRILQRFVTVPRRRNTDPLAPWIDALSLVRLGLVDPAEVEARYGGDVDGLTDVYHHYVGALERDGVVDFDGQISRAIQVLLTQPDARQVAQRASRILLVDEFQDLTPAHLLMLRLLAGAEGAVFGVGDDDQTIYGYNGAEPAWLIDFSRWFPGAGDHPLEVNYRCPAGVVDAADRLLRHNRRRVDKTIRAFSSDAAGWSKLSTDDPVTATVDAIHAALADGAQPAEIAVLTRVNATIAPVQVALSTAGIPISGGVGTEFADRTAIRASLAWLRLASGQPFTPDDLGEALRRPSRPLHPRIGEWVAEQRDISALVRLADRLTNAKDADRVNEFASDIGRLQAMVAAKAPTAVVIAALVDDIGLGGAVATLDNSRTGMNRSAQGDDLLALRQLARLHDDVSTFESWLRDRLSVRRQPGGVVLATVHRVKGQEWPHVVVHLADVDQYPHRLAEDDEEERRLFHVAITRASQHVTIVSSEFASPFVAELTTEPPEHPPEPPPRALIRSAAPPAPSTRRRTGDASDHPLLDRGTVMAVPGLVLVDQGHEWTVIEIEPEAAVAERDGATRRFTIGAKVETIGRQRGALGARSGDVSEAAVVVFDRLRIFRDRARNGKPAYTVFDDKTLAAIASALPSSLDEMARVKGVGPSKLEQYGDDVLNLVADYANEE